MHSFLHMHVCMQAYKSLGVRTTVSVLGLVFFLSFSLQLFCFSATFPSPALTLFL